MRFVIVTVLLALSSPALAQQAAPAPAAPVKEKKICRSLAVTGSIMGKRECHTPAEWSQIDNANSDDAKRALGARRTGMDGLGRN